MLDPRSPQKDDANGQANTNLTNSTYPERYRCLTVVDCAALFLHGASGGKEDRMLAIALRAAKE
jgi:hypothetical protein